MSGEKEAVEMAGSRLEPMQPQGPRAELILRMTRSVLLGKPQIVEKIKTRYPAFKRACAR